MVRIFFSHRYVDKYLPINSLRESIFMELVDRYEPFQPEVSRMV